MSFIYFIVIGALAGFLAGQVMKGNGFGLLVNILLGIAGSIFGGWIFGVLGISIGGLIGSLVTATCGAVVLIYIVGIIKKK